ncbi:MAG TPA: phosphodiester glycosidase family protein [Vicinamibacterales bacterium]|nr:phosphodiester glycosidase family protein [Vicinamibacterales bacterium]
MRMPTRFWPFSFAVSLIALAAAATLAQPAAPVWTTVAPGVEHAHFRREAPTEGAWNINVLRIDMTQARLDVIRARDTAIGLETVTSIASRVGAIAAINGGYFRTSGDFLGDSTGTLQIDGVVWSEPDRARAAVGIVRGRRASRLIFGHVAWQASIEAGRAKRTVDGLNRARGPNDLVVFTPEFGPATITDASGIEVVVRSGRVVDLLDDTGNTTIPSDGFVVSARGEARDWVRRSLRKGTRVRVRTTLRPADPSRSNPWAAAEDILGAGPKLVTAGRVDVTDVREKMIPTFATDLHPRTAIASLADGRALLLVADGRRSPERVGLTLDDLAKLLIELGAVEAINLDGGGSTAMVVRGKLVNFPSDPTGERPVSDAIVVRGPG